MGHRHNPATSTLFRLHQAPPHCPLESADNSVPDQTNQTSVSLCARVPWLAAAMPYLNRWITFAASCIILVSSTRLCCQPGLAGAGPLRPWCGIVPVTPGPSCYSFPSIHHRCRSCARSTLILGPRPPPDVPAHPTLPRTSAAPCPGVLWPDLHVQRLRARPQGAARLLSAGDLGRGLCHEPGRLLCHSLGGCVRRPCGLAPARAQVRGAWYADSGCRPVASSDSCNTGWATGSKGGGTRCPSRLDGP